MSNTLIEFTAGQYQSAFQLAAALNFGLSIFRVLRQPAQEEVIDQARALLELAKNSSNLASSKMQLMEQAARDKCIKSGMDPEVEFPNHLDQPGHLKATEKMVEFSVLEMEAQRHSSEISNKISSWIDTDGFIGASAVLFFFCSLFCLGYSTVYSGVKLTDDAAIASTCAFSVFAIINYTPVILSFFFALLARWRLSTMKTELRSCERKILRLHFTK